jgi:hypothetical protein
LRLAVVAGSVLVVALSGCSSGKSAAAPEFVGGPSASAPAATVPELSATSAGPSPSPSAAASAKPAAAKPVSWGNPAGHASVPAAAKAVDTSRPDAVIGKGTPAGCTSAAVAEAVAEGGVVTFDCGPAPVTITMTQTAKVRNANQLLVLDGGGKVTLSGGGKRRILYQNTCDKAQGWTTSHCQDQETPRLTVQNLVLADGDSSGQTAEGGGGGAIFVRGGRLTVVNSRFVGNRCDRTGPDLGGAAIRVLSQYHGQPVYITGSTFEKGSCSNGGALSSIGVSWTVLNSVLKNNSAVGSGANPAKSGTPGGGSGGAIYNDGDAMALTVSGTLIQDNHAREGGGAIFFVSNDRTGTVTIRSSTLRRNPSAGFETQPGIFFLGAKLTR